MQALKFISTLLLLSSLSLAQTIPTRPMRPARSADSSAPPPGFTVPSGFLLFGATPTQSLTGYHYSGSYAEINGTAWDTAGTMPNYEKSAAYAQFGGNAYVFGVLDSQGHPTLVYMFDSSTNTWISKQSMPTTRFGATAVVYGSLIYVFGGGDVNGTPLSTCEIYNPVSDSWGTGASGCASLPTSAISMSGAAIPSTAGNSGIYLFGGKTVQNNSTVLLNQTIRYDPTANTYTSLANLPTAVWLSTAVYANGLIYVMGGASAAIPTGINQNLAYDPSQNTFTAKTNLPDNRAYHSAVVSNLGQICVTGDALGSNLKFLVYDPIGDSFANFPQLLRGRSGNGSALLGDGRIVVFGGSVDDVVDIFHPDRVLYEFVAN